MENQSNKVTKEQLRVELKAARKALHYERRDQASRALVSSLVHHLSTFENVLSFSSFQTEINTSLLNLFLSRTNRLILPKVRGDELRLYRVLDCDKHLKSNSFGLKEPIPEFCEEVSYTEVDIILVPALGFDRDKNRLGYGGGYYDRLLHTIFTTNPECSTIGVGFKEQLIKTVPTDAGDIPLAEVALF